MPNCPTVAETGSKPRTTGCLLLLLLLLLLLFTRVFSFFFFRTQDDDIDTYLIKDNKEVKAKEKIWMSMNGEFLEAQEEKAKRVRLVIYLYARVP